MSNQAKDVDRSNLLRIGEIAKRAGVARGTIQHYLREGLLPQPVKTHPNMAYYAPETVDRIRLIKELQTSSYMPLSEIRELLGRDRDEPSLAQAVVHAQEAALKAISPAARSGALTARQAAKQLGLRVGLIEQLVELKIVTSQAGDAEEPVFTGVDLEVLAAIAKLKNLGFTERGGFKAEDIVIYREALQRLLQKELQTFLRVLGSKKRRKKTAEMAHHAVEGATMLLLALRKKSIIDFLEEAGMELKTTPE